MKVQFKKRKRRESGRERILIKREDKRREIGKGRG